LTKSGNSDILKMGEKSIMHVYAIQNRVNDKIYIGQTVQNLERYLRSDITRALLKGEDRKPHLYNAIRKWGPENFSIHSLVEALDKDQADKLEQFFIRTLETQDRDIGYNIAAGGGGSFGYKRIVSDEQREKFRVTSTGRKQSEETKAKRVATMTANGKMLKSPEWRQKISQGKMGKKPKPFSEEHKQHMSEAAIAAHARRKENSCLTPH
jgi:group I intron endonuclease